jgi:hypothetical protein
VRHRAPAGPGGLARLHGAPAPGAQRLLVIVRPRRRPATIVSIAAVESAFVFICYSDPMITGVHT